MLPFGVNEKLQTVYLLLKGMRTINLIDVQSGEVTMINESMLDMFGSSNSMTYTAVPDESRLPEPGQKDNYEFSILSVENQATISEIMVDVHAA